MISRLVLAALVAASLAGCAAVSESRLNPLNWFGRGQKAEVAVEAKRADPRELIAQVTDLRVEQVPGGAIIRATGLPPRQGYYAAELLPVGREEARDGVLSYEFRAAAPAGPTLVGPPRSREIIVGRFVSTQKLAGVRQIRVSGATNALAVRR